jgi:pimeloyl-ACP methyl ester carboxylesterase
VRPQITEHVKNDDSRSARSSLAITWTHIRVATTTTDAARPRVVIQSRVPVGTSVVPARAVCRSTALVARRSSREYARALAASLTSTTRMSGTPPRFLLAGTSYGGTLALKVVTKAPGRVSGLWLMGCLPGPHRDLAAARGRNDRVQRGEFEAVVEELAATITHEGGLHAFDASNSFRRMARRAGPGVFLRQNTSLLARPDRRPGGNRLSDIASLGRRGPPRRNRAWPQDGCPHSRRTLGRS